MTRRGGVLCALGTILMLAGCGDDTVAADGGFDATTTPGEAGLDSGPPVTLCASDTECSNSDFCDGVERCMPGTAGAGADGCVPGEAPCRAGEVCDEATDGCTPDDCVDEDGDGFTTCEGDCDDTRDDINPSTEELCVADDPTDEDCDPRTYGFVDIDMDGAADARCFNLDTDGTRFGGTDCDDNNASISPTAAEVCDGRLDENCDGTVDEDCLCTPEGSVRDCGPDLGACTDAFQTCTAGGWATCSVTPTDEICDGSVDENCDGSVDEGCACTTGDTRSCQQGICAGTERCEAGRWSVCLAGDGTPAPLPGTVEELCNGRDDDCDGSIDDVSGLGSTCGTNVGECSAGTLMCNVGAMSLDCGGGYVASTTETCNHLDDDCDGARDDGVGLASACVRTFSSYVGAPSSLTPLNLSRVSPNPAAAYGRGWTGDFGRSSFYRATFAVSGGGGTPDWAMTLVLAPEAAISAGAPCTGGWCNTNGLPPLAPGQRAIAVQIYDGVLLTLLNGTSSGWSVVASGTAGLGCRTPGAGMTYDIELFHTRGSFRATMRGDGCGFTTTTWNDDSVWTELYGQQADFPRYNVGAVGHPITSSVQIDLTSLYIDRRTSASGAEENCIGCT